MSLFSFSTHVVTSFSHASSSSLLCTKTNKRFRIQIGGLSTQEPCPLNLIFSLPRLHHWTPGHNDSLINSSSKTSSIFNRKFKFLLAGAQEGIRRNYHNWHKFPEVTTAAGSQCVPSSSSSWPRSPWPASLPASAPSTTSSAARGRSRVRFHRILFITVRWSRNWTGLT